eukprot:NODE_562_length_5998_cov_1.109849.p3 type:complete len:212 gc:universal NODE_562_length_5998_cov_1.109849:2352-1717(-)
MNDPRVPFTQQDRDFLRYFDNKRWLIQSLISACGFIATFTIFRRQSINFVSLLTIQYPIYAVADHIADIYARYQVSQRFHELDAETSMLRKLRFEPDEMRVIFGHITCTMPLTPLEREMYVDYIEKLYAKKKVFVGSILFASGLGCIYRKFGMMNSFITMSSLALAGFELSDWIQWNPERKLLFEKLSDDSALKVMLTGGSDLVMKLLENQ